MHHLYSSERSCGRNGDRQNDIDEDDRRSQNATETSNNHEQALKSAQHSQKQSVPVVNVTSEIGSKSPRKMSDILKAKEKALLSNSSIPRAESAERLGPNKNSIIKESINCKK